MGESNTNSISGESGQIELSSNFRLPSGSVLDKLQDASYNWFAFVTLLQQGFRDQGFVYETLDQYLINLASQLEHLGLSEENLKLVQESRTAYPSHQLTLEAECFHQSESSAESGSDDETLTQDKEAILRALEKIKDKSRKKAKEEIEVCRLMRKKVSSSTK